MTTSSTTARPDHVGALEEAYSAFGQGDVTAVLALLDPRVAWTEAAGSAYAGTYVGGDAVVRAVFAPLGEDWEIFIPRPSEFLPSGSTVVVLGDFVGTHRTTGRSMTSRFAHVIRLVDGRITSFESINDTVAVRAAMA